MAIAERKDIDGGWGWVLVGAGCLVYLIVFGLLRCQSVLFVHIVDEFDSNYSEVAWVSSIATASFSFAGVLAAPLIAKIGHRLTVMAGGFVATVGYIVACVAPSLIVLIISAGILTGIGMGVAFVATPVIIGHYFEKKRSLAINLASIGASLGTLSVCPLNEWLTDMFGLQGYFLIFSGILLNLSVAGMLMRPPPEKDIVKVTELQECRREVPNEESSLVQRQQKEPSSNNVGKDGNANCLPLTIRLFTNRSYLIYCISQVVFLAGFLCNQLYIVPYAVVEIGIPKIKASLLMSIGAICEIVSRVLFGFLGDVEWIDRIWLFTIVLFILSVSAALLPLMKSFTSIAAMIAFTGLFQGGFSGMSVVILADIVGLKLYAAGLGISTMLNGIGTLLTPPVAGHFVDLTGRPSTALFISAGILFMGAVFSAMIKVSMYYERRHLKSTGNQTAHGD